MLSAQLERPAVDPGLWLLDEKVAFLNHGSFGSCPRHVLEFQHALRERLERQPVQFFVRDLEPLLDEARAKLAAFLGAQADDVVFVPNATSGVNTVLRSLDFKPGDELIVTDHEYNACRNALNVAAQRAGAQVVVAEVPFPFRTEEELVAPVMRCVTPRTRLALLDQVSSQTGVVFPLAKLVRALAERGVDTLVDGAHAPGMVALNLDGLGAAYYTGNCHKWLCAPKGAGFLHVRRDRQQAIRPLAISHGANSSRKDRSRLQIEFGWTGTSDPTAWLTVPEAIRFVGALLPGGWPDVMQHNRALALAGRRLVCDALGIQAPCRDEFIGSLASMPLPDSTDAGPPTSPLYADPLQDRLRVEHGIEVPVIPWPAPPKRVIRISAQLYNSLPQYRALGAALRATLGA
ncbi:MAG: aminotransferase class V-fold PLP-dependent enzyme [Verrucomicrobiota bacterium]